MNAIEEQATRISKIRLEDIAFKVYSTKEFEFLVVSLNTEGQPTSQLFIDGVDNKGVKLDPYTPFTVLLKKQKGQKTSVTTLKDTGEFYNSFEVKVFKGGFEIDAETIKGDDDLEDKYGDDLIGLTDDNIQVLIEEVLLLTLDEQWKFICNG